MPTNQLNPKHIAIVMDGNRRWAEARGLPRLAGHKKGSEVVREILEGCIKEEISYLTLYAFSSENWHRPSEEVNYLMELLRYYLRAELDNLHNNNVRLKVIGNINQLDEAFRKEIEKSVMLTKDNSGITLVVALSYGSREEITNAAIKLGDDLIAGKIRQEEISESFFAKYLYTSDIPDPDLLIRTSGEQRLSNFLLWQSAYTEFFFTSTLWPDFGLNELHIALKEYHNRERRYGKK
jgi:undecaprenyl diphosphate synthase